MKQPRQPETNLEVGNMVEGEPLAGDIKPSCYKAVVSMVISIGE